MRERERGRTGGKLGGELAESVGGEEVAGGRNEKGEEIHWIRTPTTP